MPPKQPGVKEDGLREAKQKKQKNREGIEVMGGEVKRWVVSGDGIYSKQSLEYNRSNPFMSFFQAMDKINILMG